MAEFISKIKPFHFLSEPGMITEDVYESIGNSLGDAITFGSGTFIIKDSGPKYIEFSEIFDPEKW